MGEKDITEKILADYNDVFADIMNGLLFAGEQKIRPKPSASGSVERGNAATVENTETGKIGGFWTLRRESRINGWRRNRRFSCSQQPAVRTVSRGCAGAAIGACLEEITRGWRLEFHKCRRFKGFRRATPQIGGL